MAKSQGRTVWKIRFLTPLVDCNFKSLHIVSFFCQCCRKKNITRDDCQPFCVSYKATHGVQSSSLLGRNVAIKERLCCDCLACKAQQGTGGAVLYQKIVVSYLVLMPLFASCPGSTIHGRLARVFCSDGSICFKTNANIQVGYHLCTQWS